MNLEKGREFINAILEKDNSLEHGKTGGALKKMVGTLTSMHKTPIYFWNVPNKIKTNDGTNGHWVLQKKEWHSDGSGVTATYKHSVTGEIATEGYVITRTKDPAKPFKYNEKTRHITSLGR